MDKELSVADFIKLRDELEVDIYQSVRGRLEKFRAATGVEVKGVTIRFRETRELGSMFSTSTIETVRVDAPL